MQIKFFKDKRVLLYIVIFIVFLDQTIKFTIKSKLELLDTITVIQGFFYLTYTQNTGAAYSILEGNQSFLILISIVFLIVYMYYIYKEKNLSKISIISSAFLIGGVMGNLIDRVIYHYVIDFLSFHIGSYYFPIFNIADIFIVLGFFITVIEEVFYKYDRSCSRRREYRKNR